MEPPIREMDAHGAPKSRRVHGVLDIECEPGQIFNGVRCARRDAPLCAEGTHPVPGHGCQSDTPVQYKISGLDLAAVVRERSPQFDGDCQKNQPSRPKAYRLSSGEHLARNAVAARDHCKNRDVGVGWNSICCQ